MSNSLVTDVKEWIDLDSDIKQLQSTLREKKQLKKNYTAKLISVMKQNNIDCFDINDGDGKIMYSKNKTKQAISKKYLLQTLKSYFKDDEDVQNVLTHILDNRGEKEVETIKKK